MIVLMPGQQPPTNLPVILLAFANSSARPLAHLQDEYNRLTAILAQAERNQHCRVKALPFATVDGILDVFQRADYRNHIAIFHYAGHANAYQLLLETADGKPAAWPAS